MSIEIRHVSKTFGQYKALVDVNLQVQSGELVALLGPSGSGKTTLLRIVAGLETEDSGEIWFEGEDATKRSVRDRGVGFVFQHYALFRHMTVFENVAFGLRVRPRKTRPSKKEIKVRVDYLLSMVQLDGLADRFPSQLSGGQRQRVALARALAVEPRVLLLDEPFGALDARVRQDLRRWLRKLHDELHVTSVFVTHDQEEALEVADRVVVMNKGAIEQIGTPEEVYEHPASPFVFNFLGNVNLFHGRVHGGRAQIGNLAIDAPPNAESEDSKIVAFARPHDINVERLAGPGSIPAELKHIRAVGAVVRLELARKDSGERIEAEITRERFHELEIAVGDDLHVNALNVRVFAEDYVI